MRNMNWFHLNLLKLLKLLQNDFPDQSIFYFDQQRSACTLRGETIADTILLT